MSQHPKDQLTREQMAILSQVGAAAFHGVRQPSVQGAIQKALKRAAAPETTVRIISDKQAPIDEGEWEFQLTDGVLTVIAWNDGKTEASCIRLVRRGTEIHLMTGGTEPQE